MIRHYIIASVTCAPILVCRSFDARAGREGDQQAGFLFHDRQGPPTGRGVRVTLQSNGKEEDIDIIIHDGLASE
jgi:hypothetical protein